MSVNQIFQFNLNDVGNLIKECLALGTRWAIACTFLFWVYHKLNIHQKYGIFKQPEPAIHFRTALLNWKHPFLWGVGIVIATKIFHLDFGKPPNMAPPSLTLPIPDSWVIISSPNIWTDILYAILGFYLLDLINYFTHRLNHANRVMYNEFPWGHFIHHNCVYLNPLVTYYSPLVHLSGWVGLLPYVLLLSQGLVVPTAIMHVVRTISGYVSHLGCDPLPWLSRLNHQVGGWIPWIPLHHQYHHLPFLKAGNYGNVTCLWDYVFGTVLPESVYHIENGEPHPDVLRKLSNFNMQSYLKGKTGIRIAGKKIQARDLSQIQSRE